MGGDDKGMNVNPQLLKLKDITGFTTVPDVYRGKARSWITFTYEDERPGDSGDDAPLFDTAFMQINMFTPSDFDYLATKEKVKKYLETLGPVTSIQSRVYDYDSKMIRQTTFECQISEGRI